MGGGRIVYCEFECPAKILDGFRVFQRKGEITKDDTCWRRLRDLLKRDPDQVRLCKKKNFRYLD